MSRATMEQMRAAVRMAQEDATATSAEIARETGVSQSTASRARSGDLDHLLSEPGDRPSSASPFSGRAESSDAGAGTGVPPSPPPSEPRATGSTGRTRRPFTTWRPRKQRRKLNEEPPEDAVASLYDLGCILTGAVLSFAPQRYQLTEVDRQMIILPLSRMYLRRQKLPAVSPDARDAITVIIGAFGYGYHALLGAYAGRDRGPAFRTGPGPSAPAGGPVPSQPPPARPNGGAGAATPVTPDNPFDPQFIMDRLEEELRQAAAQRAAEESAGVADSTGQGA